MILPRELAFGLEVFATVGAGLMGGLFFAFSTSVMKALAQQPPESGLRTMQAINAVIQNPLFLALFLGMALATAVLAASALLRLSSPGMPWLLAGCALYFLGAFVVTMVVNVPLNNQLAAQDPGTAAAAQYWVTIYLPRWTAWNHVRTITSLASAALLLVAIHQARSPR